ncbi:hypothetical protein HMSSN036_69360 [Paenibacillus macerans]|nr:hypothetical protein HMSSN036_69360 [Paenibacillus macerans]
MINNLDMADMWLITEITKEICWKFGVSEITAKKMIKESNFMSLLQSMPEQVHHESPQSWAMSISKQSGLHELV